MESFLVRCIGHDVIIGAGSAVCMILNLLEYM